MDDDKDSTMIRTRISILLRAYPERFGGMDAIRQAKTIQDDTTHFTEYAIRAYAFLRACTVVVYEITKDGDGVEWIYDAQGALREGYREKHVREGEAFWNRIPNVSNVCLRY